MCWWINMMSEIPSFHHIGNATWKFSSDILESYTLWMYWRKFFQLYNSNDTVRWKEANINVKGTDPLPIGFWEVCQCIFPISLLSPFRKERGPSFIQTWILITRGCFVPSLVKIGLLVLEKKSKIVKFYRRTDGQTDDGRRTTGNQKSSFELSAQVSEKIIGLYLALRALNNEIPSKIIWSLWKFWCE